MARLPYVAPTVEADAFNCPICEAYAAQQWEELRYGSPYSALIPAGVKRSECKRCEEPLFWADGRIVHPEVSVGPPANGDLSEDITADYREAASIAAKSPRGAAALLRLCIQKLCIELGLPGKNINADIGTLVERGLPVEIQQALDVVRVVGNNAVHPGEIDLADQPDTVGALFTLINAIADRMITQPKQTAGLFNALPPGIREAIAKRDGRAVS